jgi:hypothetical protein
MNTTAATPTTGTWNIAEYIDPNSRTLDSRVEVNALQKNGATRYICSMFGTNADTIEESRANARLVVSAPDLLKALAGCLEIMERAFPNGLPIQKGTLCEEQDWNTSVRAARRAIDKATK